MCFKHLKSYFLFFAICSFGYLNAQDSDLASWTSVKLNYKVNEKSTLGFKPIIRHNNDLADFQDQFVDLTYGYKINDTWKLAMLHRWVTDYDGQHGYGIFTDVAHTTKLGSKLSLVNRLRYHFGFDLDLFVNDFLRYEPRLAYNGFEKVKPFAAVDFFYSTDSDVGLAFSRYQLGGSYAISKTFSLSLAYWYEAIKGGADRNVIITSLGISLN